MKIKKFVFTFLLIFVPIIAIPLVSNGYTYADVFHLGGDEDDDSPKDEIEDIEDEIKELEEKIRDLQSQEQSLSREIQEINSQINLTQSRINYSEAQIRRKEQEIDKISGDIENLKVRIQKLREAIEYQQGLLNKRSRERYKDTNVSPIVMFFGSNELSDLVKKTQYLKIIEIQDNKLLDQMNQTKLSYEQQQALFEQKKEQEEELKSQIESEKANLENYKVSLSNSQLEKERLLEVTQNDEAKFQELLAEAQKELNQILNAVSVLKGQSGVEVEKGDVIGIQGNTGYSFGDHLHFGIYEYSSFEDITGWDWYYSNHVNPKDMLERKEVYWNTGCESAGNKNTGNGDWAWPMTNPTVSQGYGYTCWSPVYYGGKVHPAYDMYGPYGSPVFAVEDGVAYFCDNCLGDGGNGVFIFHDEKYMTVYWHLR